jgi:hypothetical protein
MSNRLEDEMDEFDSRTVHENYFRAFNRVNEILDAVQTGGYADAPRRAVRLLELALTTARNGLAGADQLKNDLRTQYVRTLFDAKKYFKVGELLGDALRTAMQFQGKDSPGVAELRDCRLRMRERVAGRWDRKIVDARQRLADIDTKAEPDNGARITLTAKLARLYQKAFRSAEMAEMYRDQVTRLTDELGGIAAPVALLAEIGADDCTDHGEVESAAVLFETYYEYEFGRVAAQPAAPDTAFSIAFLRYQMGERHFASGQRYDALPLLRQSVADLAKPVGQRAGKQLRDWANVRYVAEHTLGDCLWMTLESEEANRHYREAYRLISQFRNPQDPMVVNFFNSVVYSAGEWKEFLGS